MAKVVTGYSWSNEQITPALLNQMWTSSTFNSSAVDDSTTALSGGAVIVKDAGIVAAKLASNSVTTVKILDANVTTAKILDANVTTAKISNDAVTYDKVDTATKGEMEGEEAAGVCVPDILKHHPGVAKCCGVVTYDGSTPTVSGGYNVASVSEPTGTRRRITFTNAMANANYVVHLMEDHWGDHHHPYIVTRATTYFDLDDSEGNDTGRKIHFTVFGTLA